MQGSPRYYEFSGKIGPLGIVAVLLSGGAASIILGFVYAYAVFFIPFVYVNFLFTIFFGMGIGMAIGWGARIGKARSGAFIALAGLGFGLVGEYFQWCKYLGIDKPIKIASPGQLLEVLGGMAETGVWSIFGFSSSFPSVLSS